MYTPEEIQEIFDRYNAELLRTGRVTEAMAREFADATKGVKNYTLTLKENLKQLGQASKQAAQDITEGAKGASVFSNSVEATGNVAKTVASQFGVLGKGIGAVIGALTWFVTSAFKQSDRLFDSFQDISRSGAVGGRAMTDVFNSMKSFGYTINELDKMTALLSQNSRDFALFGGTAATGGKRLAEMVEGFKDLRVNFQAMGLTTDEQARSAARYYTQMGRLGRATEATTQGAIEYIKKQETLTRLTGLQAKDLEDARKRAEDIDNFYASLMDVDPKVADNLDAVFKRLDAIDPKKARAFALSIDGIIHNNEDQLESLFSTNFELLEFAQALKEGRINADQYMQLERDARKQTIELNQQLSRIGISGVFSKLNSDVIQVNNGLDPFARQTAKAEDEVNALAKGTDAATKAQAEARVRMIDISNNIQSFINIGVSPATRALAYLTEVVETLTSLLPGAPSKGPGRQGTGTRAGQLAAVGAGIVGGAAAGSAIPIVGTIGGGIAGGLAGYAGYQMHGGPGATTQGLRIKSGEATAGGEASPKLYALAQRIQRDLGSDLIHFSAFNDTYQRGPNSLHSQGRALDFTIKDPAKSAEIAAMIRSMPGVAKVLDEYTNPSSRATAPHIHAEISGFAGYRGMLSGPMSGYSPNLRMHGNEELSIRPAGGTTDPNSGASEGTMTKLIERVDDLISLSRNQLYVSERILKYQQ